MSSPKLPRVLLIYACACALACASTDASETSDSAASESSASSSSTTTETGTSPETETSTETGEMCTGESCASTLTLDFAHSLPLADGPHRFLIDTPAHEISCSVGTTPEGEASCFGFMFADLSWDSELVRVVLTQPFFDTEQNPEATPFATVMLRVERGRAQIFAAEVPIEGGDPIQPDPCGPVCWHALGFVTVE